MAPGTATSSAAVAFSDLVGGDLRLLAAQGSTDKGDPADAVGDEPAPNGGRINLGAFGGTAEAELSVLSTTVGGGTTRRGDADHRSDAPGQAARPDADRRRARLMARVAAPSPARVATWTLLLAGPASVIRPSVLRRRQRALARRPAAPPLARRAGSRARARGDMGGVSWLVNAALPCRHYSSNARPPDDPLLMLNGLVSALLVIAGGGCAVAGYVLGSWHQRRAMEAELAR